MFQIFLLGILNETTFFSTVTFICQKQSKHNTNKQYFSLHTIHSLLQIPGQLEYTIIFFAKTGPATTHRCDVISPAPLKVEHLTAFLFKAVRVPAFVTACKMTSERRYFCTSFRKTIVYYWFVINYSHKDAPLLCSVDKSNVNMVVVYLCIIFVRMWCIFALPG